jgi:PhnB protein
MTQNRSTTGIIRIEPYLYYEDVEASLQWLAMNFGFREVGERKTEESGVVTHAAMEHDGGVLMMGYPGPQYRSPKRSGERHCSFHVWVSDIEAHFQRAKEAGAVIIEQLKTTEHGHRRYGAEDLEGQHWYFAQPV